jgi:hypothetical protein
MVAKEACFSFLADMILWVMAGGGFPHHLSVMKTMKVTKNGVPIVGKKLSLSVAGPAPYLQASRSGGR